MGTNDLLKKCQLGMIEIKEKDVVYGIHCLLHGWIGWMDDCRKSGRMVWVIVE